MLDQDAWPVELIEPQVIADPRVTRRSQKLPKGDDDAVATGLWLQDDRPRPGVPTRALKAHL